MDIGGDFTWAPCEDFLPGRYISPTDPLRCHATGAFASTAPSAANPASPGIGQATRATALAFSASRDVALAQPTAFPAGAVAVASGRQALGLVARVLRNRGINRILVPAYYCLTMIEPFQLEGISIQHVPVGTDLLPDPAALHAATEHTPGAAILFSTTCGNTPRPALAALLSGQAERGRAIVADITHAGPGTPPPDFATYTVLSLRKWLPIPDGAWAHAARGAAALPTPTLPSPDDRVTTLKLAGLRGTPSSEAEEAVDAAREPTAISAAARHLLAALDIARIMRRRRQHAAILVDYLQAAGVPAQAIVAASAYTVALRTPHAEQAAQRLAQEHVYTPMYWPRPSGFPHVWPDVMALPVDQRLDASALRRVASAAVRATSAAVPGRQ